MNKMSQKRNVLSLFSGCGGMDLGFEGDFDVHKKSVNLAINCNWEITAQNENWAHLGKTCFHTIFANDIRKDAKVAWVNYFKNKQIIEDTYHIGSIVDLVKRQKLGEKVFPQNVDVVTGGFPCQDFSIAGKRKGFHSDKSHDGKTYCIDEPASVENRGQLYMWMREVVALTMPNIFIAENVKGLTSLKDVKEIIEKDFSSINDDGYLVVSAQVLHAADFGVPQSRERVIFFGFKKSALTQDAMNELQKATISSKYNPYPPITHSFTTDKLSLLDLNNPLLPPVTSGDVLADLVEPDSSVDLSQNSYSKAKFMGKHCQGQTEIDLSKIAPTIRSEHHGNIEYRRLSAEHGGKNVLELKQGLKERRLTIRECARIQTFPDDYAFVIKKSKDTPGLSASSAYKLIGNAVPPLLAYHIAKRLEDNWSLYFK